MEPLAMLEADPLDLLFENRNKSYGAYTLRKYYPQRLMISLGIVLLITGLAVIFLLYSFSAGERKMVNVLPDIILDNYISIVPPKPLPPPTAIHATRPAASVQYTTPQIVSNQESPKPMADITEINSKAIGLTSTPGEPDNGQTVQNGTTTSVEPSTDLAGTGESIIYERPEIMPEFPGGMDALKRYLMKNLRMPETGLDPGTQIKVVARFVVGSDGKVSQCEIIVPGEELYNAEVKRVILKMPDWKAGSQNHHPVAVYFSLPVNFIVEN